MTTDLIADLWTSVLLYVDETSRENLATDFVNALVDHGVKETDIESLMGIDPHLDEAVSYVLDDEDDDYNDFD